MISVAVYGKVDRTMDCIVEHPASTPVINNIIDRIFFIGVDGISFPLTAFFV